MYLKVVITEMLTRTQGIKDNKCYLNIYHNMAQICYDEAETNERHE